jgi:pimeloyl-ACP methyl ester carboxylesterase
MESPSAIAVAHDGVPIEIHVYGSGPCVLMHPLPAYPGFDDATLKLKKHLDEELVASLSARYRLVMFEYPGDPKPATLTPTNVVADLLAIADAASADRFAWCGYSWTAIIGVQLAIRTDRLTALIAGGWPPIGGRFDHLLDMTTHPEEHSWALDAAPNAIHEQFATFYREMQAFDDRAAQLLISCPRLCVVGGGDDEGGTGVSKIVAEHRAELEELGWDVEIVGDGDHYFTLQPEVFVPLIAEWLDAHLRPA